MKYIFLSTIILSLLFSTTKSFALINGVIDHTGKFPFVALVGGCTATKVSPQHYILAAHCYMQKIKPLIHTMKNSKQALSLDNSQISLHPSWIETCSKINCSGLEIGTPQDNPRKVDLAIVKLAKPDYSIPFVQIDYGSINTGESVVIAGFGCTADIGEEGDGLRYAESIVVSADIMKHQHSLYAPVADLASQSNFVTPGYSYNTRYSSLCPGDSGGPVFRMKNSSPVLIGINADYTFFGPYERSISVTNVHTRISDDSFYSVGKWVREQLLKL
ncbi:MAG: trypsin-like serine protease [Oligoflexia bacterium]|nr:trypsin-like serine protease [Oligoflexia bacterium]